MLGFIIGLIVGFIAGILVGRNNKNRVEDLVEKGEDIIGRE